MREQVKLNIGAGSTVIPGFVPVDIKTGGRAEKLDYADGSVDEIYASHVLEHVSYRDTERVLSEWCRVLKPGGIISVAVPDRDKVLAGFSHAPSHLDAYLFGGHCDEHDVHKASFTRESLAFKLRKCGFTNIHDFPGSPNDCSGVPISLNLRAVKRRPWPIKQNPRVLVSLSAPRIWFADHANALVETLKATGWDFSWRRSAFWEKGMFAATEEAVNKNYDYILYTDYDTGFDAAMCHKLIGAMQDNADWGVLVAFQLNRHDLTPMCFDIHRDYSGDFTKITYGHFGLTAVRTEVIKEIPKPYFSSMPDPMTGRFDTAHVSDADITFWRYCDAAGITVMQANKIVTGHMILAMAVPTAQGTAFQPMENFASKGLTPSAVFEPEVYRKQIIEAGIKAGRLAPEARSLIKNHKPAKPDAPAAASPDFVAGAVPVVQDTV